jgi:uncharacterized protein (TIGR03085 family)
VNSYAPGERSAMADLMQELGPDAPTLCAGWATRDLAAHIVVRERRPLAALGIVVKQLAPRTKRVQDSVAGRDWPGLLAELRRRPAVNALLDEPLNRIEFFIHHEDVRRAQPGWAPRELPAGYAEVIWRRVRTLTRLVLRKIPAAVTVGSPGLSAATGGRGGPAVTLTGAPAELLLFLSGRQAHAVVELTGPEQITQRMRTARFGI